LSIPVTVSSAVAHVADGESVFKKCQQFGGTPHSQMLWVLLYVFQDSLVGKGESLLSQIPDRLFRTLARVWKNFRCALGKYGAGDFTTGGNPHAIGYEKVLEIAVNGEGVLVVLAVDTRIRQPIGIDIRHGFPTPSDSAQP
jgi:hypothetical protein